MLSFKPLFGYLAYHNIKLPDFAAKSGVSYPTLLKMKREATFNTKVLDKICQTLNLNIDDILVYENNLENVLNLD